MAASATKKKSKGGRPNRPGAGKGRASQKRSAQQRPPVEPVSFSKAMPVLMQNLLIGVILLMFTLSMGLLPQYVICAITLGFAVWQIFKRKAAWLWTWMSFVAVALFLVSVQVALRYPATWLFCVLAWVLVITTLVGEGSRTLRRPRGKAAG